MRKYLIFLLLLASCANPKKLHKMMDKLPVAAAKECSTRFPVKETVDTLIVSDSMLLEAYQDEYNRLVMLIDSLLNDGCDTMYIDKIKEKIKKIPCKPEVKYIVKTQENTAKLQVLKDSCSNLVSTFVTINEKNETSISNLTNANGKLKKQNTWLWIVVIIMGIWMNRKRILSLLKGIL
jgi:hypothetical protein